MIAKHLEAIYSQKVAHELLPKIEQLIANYSLAPVENARRFSESDAILITYGDQITSKDKSPLATLNEWVGEKLNHAVSAVHLLPFYPYSSDGGFSVIDYKKVCKEMGEWKDVESFSKKLMFDAVFNHISAGSEWFQSWLKEGKYDDYFISYDPKQAEALKDELAKVTRPRALPLLSRFETSQGEKMVWTTFSEDQIDLNFASPNLLLELVDTLLLYLQKGAKYIRIDAVPFFWKEVGTSCAHHSKTHSLVKLFRAVVEAAGSDCLIITESNVPHLDNISYFGSGNDEAHMVYNFSLAPLILHGALSKSAKHLYEWSNGLQPLGTHCSFFNFTGTHDGIGLRPLEGILPTEQTLWLCEEASNRGGKINYKKNEDGSESPYEMAITWASALFDESLSESKWIRRVVSSHLAMCSFPGVPGMYIHNFLGTQNWYEGLEATGHNRDINRRKFDASELEEILSKPFEKEVYERLTNSLSIRRSEAAFHPKGDKKDFFIADSVWSFLRTSPDGKEKILVLYNLDDHSIELPLEAEYFGVEGEISFENLLGADKTVLDCSKPFHLGACAIAWLKIRG